ncbi:L,D-transpeptidase family protein [Sediminibacterium ginsengisoli]|uniref:L,D-transpeptidase catalytic domain n=1 Tax=Sediminibacterium ginsengisoli TaxID=413434 RepID=A0A1T4MCH4_9BACT|nr:L,D-transpeptidase family protein [Sediminibacterium ginsengisoli]SJZ64567.1 L,D-transpeptidase catalytic domain [Sediminibacterium ginsengisoli]
MRNFLLTSLVALGFFTACNNEIKKEQQVSERDLSITRVNAYNDLFLDTAAVNTFITKEQMEPALANRFRSFYNRRNFQFAWLASDGLTEQARSFWNAVNYKQDSALEDKKLKAEMKDLWSSSTQASASDKDNIRTELLLTKYFMNYMLTNYEQGTVKKKDLESLVPRKKEPVIVLADSFVSKKAVNNEYEAANSSYKLLKDQLALYVGIAKKGGWQLFSVPAGKKFKKNGSDPLIPVIKKHLALTGDMAAGDTTAVFNEPLEAGIKSYQARMGYKPDGVISPAIIKEMNVPVNKRIQQLVINLDRMRWLPDGDNGKLIVTNIPEFKVHVYDGSRQEFEMPVVVGKDGHNTVIFTGTLSQVVFSPYWNVPPSIVKNEILPKMNSDKSYLDQEDMEVVSESGGLPVIRQRPGPKNSLGKVKFLFPNDFNIYFHDTPAKSLFSQDQRAFSHGCIRLSDPVKMANYLLKDDAGWDAAKINAAMNAGKEKTVELKTKIPVLITYYTAWVDAAGKLNFRDDIYGHDAAVAHKMFTNPL